MEMKSTILYLFLLQTILNVVNMTIAEPINSDIIRCKKDSGTFQPNSRYKENLMSALKKLATETPKDPGFNYVLAGDRPETASAVLLCAVYLNPKDCASCVNKTIQLLVQKCPDQKRAVAWRVTCMVRYGPFVTNNYDVWFVAHEVNEAKVKDVEGLDKALSMLVGNLPKIVYKDPAGYAYATQPYGSPSLSVHMVMQCTLDIPPSDCDKCLLLISREIKSCCSGAISAAVLTPNCYMRYAHDDFRNLKHQSTRSAPRFVGKKLRNIFGK